MSQYPDSWKYTDTGWVQPNSAKPEEKPAPKAKKTKAKVEPNHVVRVRAKRP